MKTQILNLMTRVTFFRYLFVFALAFVAISCDEDTDIVPEQPQMETLKSIPDLLEGFESSLNDDEIKAARLGKAPTFHTLMAALTQTGLIDDVAKNQLTLFAPSDDAFAALGLDRTNIGSVPGLTDILLYHAVAGKVFSTQLTEGFVPTLNGAAVEIKLDGEVMVNMANVIFADKRALNGVVHVIDRVMLPPTVNLVELALSLNPEFSILVQAVTKAGLGETLATGGPFTVFAPTNEAFVALLAELNFNSLDEIPVDVLTKVLLYHVVEGRVYSSDLTSGPVNALGGTFSVDTSTLTLTDANGREAGLIPSLLNVQATNGVVHVINKVILPEL